MRRLLLVLVVLPGLVLTLVRLWQPSTTVGLVLTACASYGVLVYGLGLLFSCVRLGLTQRPHWGVPAVACACGVLLHAWWLAPQFTGPNPPPASGSAPLRILTVNLHLGEADTGEVVREVTAQHVDLLVVEEVTPAAAAGLRRSGLDGLLPHAAGSPKPGAGGTMVFAKAALGASQPLGLTFDGWRVQVQTSPAITLDAVHVAPPTMATQWQGDLAKLRGERPTLMAGDFNSTPDHAPFARLTEHLTDAAQVANAGWQPTWPAQLPLFAIDHVLVDRDWAVLSTRSVTIPGTDHRGLLVSLAAK